MNGEIEQGQRTGKQLRLSQAAGLPSPVAESAATYEMKSPPLILYDPNAVMMYEALLDCVLGTDSLLPML
jgi:hypothetical protein